MHSQGLTFFKSGKEQAKPKHGFLSCIRYYVDVIKERPNDFGLLETDALIKALGAFRYLYKRSLDDTTTIHRHGEKDFKVASGPRQFFDKHEDCNKIDKYFVDQLNLLNDSHIVSAQNKLL